jgi:aspartate/methionine/tyrosine aminotransferase
MSENPEPLIRVAFSRRALAAEPFRVMEILAEARRAERAGANIIHLEVGEPDFATPRPVVEKAASCARTGLVRYTAAEGLPELRAAISEQYRHLHGLEIDPNRVIITAGASAALQLALACTTDVGDSVLLPDPGYPCNRQFVAILGAESIMLEVDARTAFQPTPEQVAVAWRANTRAVVLASPANPTGNCFPAAHMSELTQVLRQRNGFLIMDEIYNRLVFERSPETALTYCPEAFVVNSFSKYAAMTGWRLGWMVVPEAAIDPVRRLAQNLFVAPSTVAQHAALALFDPTVDSLLQTRIRALATRRDFLLSVLPGIGLKVKAIPEGAFYIYADCSALGDDSEVICARILREAHVALTPGTDFSAATGRQHLRIAYTQPLEVLRTAVERIAAVV